MSTRVIVRQLLIRAGILLLTTILFLVSMNLVTDSRLEAMKQEDLYHTYASVLAADRYVMIHEQTDKQDIPEISAAYAGYDKNGQVVGYVIESNVISGNAEFVCQLGFSPDGTSLLAVAIVDQSNSSAFSPIMTPEFLAQFSNARLPMALTVDLPDEDKKDEVYPPIAGLQDGVFRAELEDPDESGYLDYVEITVVNGRIEQVVWDAIQSDGGNNRAQASVNGEYKLSDNTTIWAAQAYAMQNKLIEVQDPAKIAIKASGTTDVVPGVSISVNAFLTLSSQCIEDSKNAKVSESGVGEATRATSDVSNTDTTGASQDTTSNDSTDETNVDNEVYAGSEDGVLKDTDQNQLGLMIDGYPIADIHTKILNAEGEVDLSRSVIQRVNFAYRFLSDYRKGEA